MTETASLGQLALVFGIAISAIMSVMGLYRSGPLLLVVVVVGFFAFVVVAELVYCNAGVRKMTNENLNRTASKLLSEKRTMKNISLTRMLSLMSIVLVLAVGVYVLANMEALKAKGAMSYGLVFGYALMAAGSLWLTVEAWLNPEESSRKFLKENICKTD
jgi:MFS family permease